MCMCLRNQLKAKPGTEILPACCIKKPPEMPGGVPGLSFFFFNLFIFVIGQLWVLGSELLSLRGGCRPCAPLLVRRENVEAMCELKL